MKPKIDHAQAVLLYRRSNGMSWRFAFAASLVVGNYDKGATAALAQDIMRSPDTVERYARAAKTVLMLCAAIREMYDKKERHEMFVDLAKALRVLNYLHLDAMGRLWKHYEFDPKEFLCILSTAAQNGVSASKLEKEVRHERGENNSTNHEDMNKAAESALRNLADVISCAEKQGEESPLAIHDVTCVTRTMRNLLDSDARDAKKRFQAKLRSALEWLNAALPESVDEMTTLALQSAIDALEGLLGEQ